MTGRSITSRPVAPRSNRWRAAIVTVIVAADLAACGGFVAAGPSASAPVVASATASITPTGSPGSTGAATPDRIRLIPPEAVPLTPLQSVALPDAEMWVFIPTEAGIWTVQDPGDALVLRDPATFKEIRRIEGAATIHATTIAFGAAWSTDYDTDTLHRYDLETGEHTAIAVGPGAGRNPGNEGRDLDRRSQGRQRRAARSSHERASEHQGSRHDGPRRPRRDA
jgi:hypothetical protein